MSFFKGVILSEEEEERSAEEEEVEEEKVEKIAEKIIEGEETAPPEEAPEEYVPEEREEALPPGSLDVKAIEIMTDISDLITEALKGEISVTKASERINRLRERLVKRARRKSTKVKGGTKVAHTAKVSKRAAKKVKTGVHS